MHFQRLKCHWQLSFLHHPVNANKVYCAEFGNCQRHHPPVTKQHEATGRPHGKINRKVISTKEWKILWGFYLFKLLLWSNLNRFISKKN